MPQSRTCQMCLEEFPVPESAYQAGRKVFCSTKCNDEWNSAQPVHPYMDKVPPGDPAFPETLAEAYQLRMDRILMCQLEKADPWQHGYRLPHWAVADREFALASEFLVSGGNRSAKTEWAAWKVVQMLLSKENANALCCHTSNATSVTVQQPAIFKYLPMHLRQTRKSKVHYLNYSRKNGFTDGSFILPNGSRCDMLNYTQSSVTIEGREADIVWCDELVPSLWVETLRFRLITRRGKLLVTQTPLEGVASVYKEFVAGAKVTEWMEAELLEGRAGQPTWPPGKVPRVMVSPVHGRRTVFMGSHENLFSPWEEMRAKLVGAPTGQILTRAYGWATDNNGKAFTRFAAEVHCIPESKVPTGGTLYQVVDPAGARNWFALWVRVYEDGKIIVVREHPDFNGYGEWTLPSEKADGKPGPAQTMGAGRGFMEYRQLFREVESALPGAEPGLRSEEPLARYIDPKSGGTAAISEAGGITLIELLSQDSDQDEGMMFLPAAGVPVSQRMAAINSALSWDVTKPITPLNEPKLYVVDSCHNLIWALSEHTGRDGQKGASKDPIDCLGMLLISQCEHVGERGMASVGGGTY